MTRKILISAALILVSSSIWAYAASQTTAKCLLEVKEVNYIGGLCKFSPIDQRGSFKILDIEGRGLIAQVIVTDKDKGSASWNGPIGGSSQSSDLGIAYRSGGCWEADSS